MVSGAARLERLAWETALVKKTQHDAQDNYFQGKGQESVTLSWGLVPGSATRQPLCRQCGKPCGLEGSPNGLRADAGSLCCRHCGATTNEIIFDDSVADTCTSSGNSMRFTGGTTPQLSDLRRVNAVSGANIPDAVLVGACKATPTTSSRRDAHKAMSAAIKSAAKRVGADVADAQVTRLFTMRASLTGVAGYAVSNSKKTRNTRCTYGNTFEELPGLARDFLLDFTTWAVAHPEGSPHERAARTILADVADGGAQSIPRFAQRFIIAADKLGVGQRRQFRSRMPAAIAVVLVSLGVPDPRSAISAMTNRRVNNSRDLFNDYVSQWRALQDLFNDAGLPYPNPMARGQARIARERLDAALAAF